ncbi:VOC family protein [Agrococcus citreus]|uniref:VOC family protein n=1 Tax=Agrococcus citreus TaxID=84643 RepID=A0ABP4JNQ5_9MICO
MSKHYPIGTTVWQELRVASDSGLAAFYRAVLDWELELEGDRGRFRAADGEVVAGLQLVEDLAPDAAGWIAFLGAGDLAADVQRAVEAGATVMEEGVRLAVPGDAVLLHDPFGAVFGIAELPAGSGTVPSGALGHLSMVDPTNHDLAAQIEFQLALFPGAAVEALDHGIHFVRDAAGNVLRGAYEVAPEARAFLPPHWLPWFNVVDQGAAVEAAAVSGGRINTRDNELSFGIWGVVVDPAGGEFKALQLSRDEL